MGEEIDFTRTFISNIIGRYYPYLMRFILITMNFTIKTITKGVLGLLITTLLFVGVTAPVEAATECTFNRTLKLGVEGEDVRCLQKFLNTSGYTISLSGAGSVGKETDEFRTFTNDAVMRWQEAHGLIADGIFGPSSQAKYKTKVSGSTTVPVVTKLTTPTAIVMIANEEKSAIQAMKKALDALADVEIAIDDADDDGQNTSEAEEDFLKASKDMFDAMRYFLAGNFAKAQFEAEDAIENADEAFEETGGEEKEDARKALDDISDMYDDAEDDIDDADDDGIDVDGAENYLRQADEYIELAEDAYDDGDYDDALDYIDDAENRIEDALDEIDEDKEKDEAEDEIDEAKDDLRDAQDEVEEADDDGDDVDDAEDLLDEAEDLIDDAEDEYDDEDYDRAIKLAKEAQELIDDALDEL